MSVNNTITVAQAAAVMNNLVAQATGSTEIAQFAGDDFISAAQTALKTGYDPILNALSQVMTRTIFSVRPYSAKFTGIKRDMETFGNFTRKFKVSDKEISDDSGFKYPVAYDSTQTENPYGDGESVDMYAINKPKVLQTNFYSRTTWQDSITEFKNQLDVSFSSASEFAQFLSMCWTYFTNKHEQYSEEVARGIISNAIGALIDEGNNDRVIHLLTDYNTWRGTSYTAQTVTDPTVYRQFRQYIYSRIMSLSDMFENRSMRYQTNIDGYTINQSTPKSEQRLYLLSRDVYAGDTMALANTFDSDLLQYGDYERVNYWQSIETPDSIAVTPVYTGTDGAAKVGTAKEQAGVFGILCDRDAMGYAEFDSTIYPTPFNARGRYTTFWANSLYKCWFDCTEKAVVLLMD